MVFELLLGFDRVSNGHPSPVFYDRVNQECRVAARIDGYVYPSVMHFRYQWYAVIDRNLTARLVQRPDGIKAFKTIKTLERDAFFGLSRNEIALRAEPFNAPGFGFHPTHGLLGAPSPIALSTTLPISRVSYPPSPSSSSRKFLLTIMSRSLFKPGSAS